MRAIHWAPIGQLADAQRGTRAANFFIAVTGGPDVYRGKDMRSVHAGMNASAVEYMAALDDALAALESNGVGQREQEEVLFVPRPGSPSGRHPSNVLLGSCLRAAHGLVSRVATW